MGFDKLNLDCLCNIVECVTETSPHTVRDSLRFVNKEVHAVCKLVGHRRKTLKFPPNRQNAGVIDPLRFSDLYENEDVCRSLHHLTIQTDKDFRPTSYLYPEDFSDPEVKKFACLVTLLSELRSLRCLTWSYDGPIPVDVLDALHKYHPKAELRFFNFTRSDIGQEELDPAEKALVNSKALVTIRARIRFEGQVAHPDLREALFKKVVATAPNLRTVSVIRDFGAPGLHALSNEQLQEVHELNDKMLQNTKPNPSVRSLTLDGYDLNDRTLQEWGQLVDLSSLESIKCSRGLPTPSYFVLAPQVLKNLKHVSLNLTTGHTDLRDIVQNYISETAPLESLSLWAWMESIPLQIILERHGKTLRTLQLHERELVPRYGQERRKLLSTEDLKSIKSSCPKLRDLTIDIDRFTSELDPDVELTHYSDKLDVLSSMDLDSLQIYYDLGLPRIACTEHNHHYEEIHPDNRDDDYSPEKDPANGCRHLRMSTNSAIEVFVKALWKRIFGHRLGGSRRELDVKFGEWERKRGGPYPPHWLMIENWKKTFCEVRPEERDDRVGECVGTMHGVGQEF
jgi:hypothetical protein